MPTERISIRVELTVAALADIQAGANMAEYSRDGGSVFVSVRI